MILSNRLGIILLAVLLGWANRINFIGAQSYLLSQLPPIYAVYLSVGFSLAFSYFLHRFRLQKFKFSLFVFIFLLCFILILVSLTFKIYPTFLIPFLWYLLAICGIAFFKWTTTELAIRHLGPARVHSSLPYIVMADEIGTVGAALSLKSFASEFGPNQMIYLSVAIYTLMSLFIFSHFLPRKNLEVKYSKKKVHPPQVSKKVFNGFKFALILMAIGYGIFKISEDYLIKVVLKEELIHFETIKNVSADYFLLGSLLVILTSPIIGHLIDKKRLSPTLFLSLQTILMLGIGVTCLIYPSLYFFLALEVARNLTSGSLYHPSYQMILSSFVETYRNRLQSFYNFYYFAVVGISLIVLFSFTTYLFPSIERTFLLWLVLFSMLFIFGITFLLKKKWCDLLYAFIQSKHKAASIIAVHALSFVRPKNFDQRMEKLLTLEPKKLLRKTIILGLGYSTKGSTTERIIREFRSEKEEIQIAVLDALRASHHYKGIQFMLNLLMGQERPKSIRVRIHATLMIAAIYGKKAIPFLLNGLQDQDFRVVANTLETLSIYRDKKLIPHFERFVDSQDLRVCANALMGLAYFRKTKKMYREGVCKILTGGDLRHISSILYVIGKLKDHRFKNEVDALAKTALIEEVAVIPSLTWTWIRWRDPRGFDLAGKFLGMPHQKNVQRPFMHFFSQLSAKDRFDLIQYLAIEHRSQPSFLKNLGDNLRHTSFDFHEEIEYLDLVRIG